MKGNRQGYFPLFIDIKGKNIKVIGGGTIALRRVKTLLNFGAVITVIAPKAAEEISTLAKAGKINWEQRIYKQGDCSGAFLVIAAADKREINHAVFEECREKNILISAADKKEECSFYFPAVIQEGDIVIGVTSGGLNHKGVRKAADTIRRLKDEIIQGEGEEE